LAKDYVMMCVMHIMNYILCLIRNFDGEKIYVENMFSNHIYETNAFFT